MVENNSNNTIDSFFGLLDLKKDAVLGLDGHSIVLKTDDFVGVRNLVNSLHFVSVRSQPNATVAVGFFVEQTTRCFVRKYDPQTEEISPDPVDEATVANLLDQVQHQQIAASRVLEYKAIVSDYQAQQWREQTNYIGSSNILNKREITNGGKIVPGAYHPDEDEYDLAHDQQKPAIVDGKSIIYPNIPVVDPTLSLWKNKHPGTKRYLSQLTPSQRTSLFTKGNSTSEITTRLLEDVLSKYYDNQWQNLLGDLQLSYVLFLYLHCFSSLEHW